MWSIRKKLLVTFLVLALVPLGLGGWLNYWQASRDLMSLAQEETKRDIALGTTVLSPIIKQFSTDVLTFKSYPSIQNIIRAYDNDGIDPISDSSYQVWIENLTQLFASEMARKKFYQQLRYLDEAGNEIVRVDYRDDNVLILTGTDQLQNKAHRDYFTATKQLQNNEVHISELDLNREYGVIEEPYVPVIRFGTPVFDEGGTFRGIVITNVYAHYFLDLLQQHDNQLYLINQEGYYLLHPDDTKMFGFDLGHDYNAYTDFPEAFDQYYVNLQNPVSDDRQVLFDKEHDQYIALHHIHFDPQNPQRYWSLIKFLPADRVPTLVRSFQSTALHITPIMFIFVVVGALFFSKTLTEQLNKITTTLKAVEAGKLDSRTEVIQQDEIGQLAFRVNQLLDNLTQQIEVERVAEQMALELAQSEHEKNEQLEEQLVQSQKLDSLGLLACSIAHEFNNILTSLRIHTELLLMSLRNANEVKEYGEHILQSIEQATNLVRQILVFSRKEKKALHQVQSVEPIVYDVYRMIRTIFPNTVDVQVDITPNLPPSFINASQIHQVLLNLCTNAFHALQDKMGTIVIMLQEVPTPSNWAFPTYTHENCLQLSIQDNGHGIAPENLEKVFDSFFTTKEAGKGTGLGLHIVQNIVRQHQAMITVESEVNEGSIFFVYLPIAESKAGQSLQETISILGYNE